MWPGSTRPSFCVDGRAFAFDASCHCEERSDAAIPIQLRRFLGIALMSFVNRLGKRDGIPTV
jgi:hypothetical protein